MRTWRLVVSLVAVLVVMAARAQPAAAQVVGTYRWQLLPYCNVLSLTITQQGAHYLLDGIDDQCGAGAAAARGLAFLNPTGAVGFGITIVTTPGGLPVHVDATVSVASLGGAWRDSNGRTGAFLFLVGAPAAGPPRPGAFGGSGPVRTAAFPPTTITTDPNPNNAPDLTTISFTAPFTGVAVASGTGYCLANASAAGASTSAVTIAVNGALPAGQALQYYISPISMPKSAIALDDTKIWAVQREFAVTAGATYTASVRALRVNSITPIVSCSGNLHVRVHSGTLP